MNIRYVAYGSVRVSRRWAIVLRAADRAGVRFHVTSGHRTLAEQARLFRQNMRRVNGRWVPKPGHPPTAFPRVRAPHIRVGRHAHALDVNSLDGGETRLQHWLERHGATVRNPVAGEDWHLEISGQDLKRLAQKFAPLSKPKRVPKPRPRPKPKRPYRTSPRGRSFIAGFEGFVAAAMHPVPGDPLTIGFGHTGPDVKPGMRITRERALSLLARDLLEAERAVNRAVKVELTQARFDALVSFAFNVGGGALERSTLLKLVNRRRWRSASKEFVKWNKAGVPLRPVRGLTRRRQAEAALFLRGK